MPLTLKELKEQNEKEALEEKPEEEIEEPEEEPEEEEHEEESSEKPEPEEEPEEKPEDKEPWQMTDEDEAKAQKEEKEEDSISTLTHLKVKQKIKGRLKDSEEENKRLREEVERLKGKGGKLKEPKPEDFESNEEFEAAKKNYDNAVLDERIRLNRENDRKLEEQRKAIEQRKKSVDKHYDRAAKLISESGMKAENFQKADKKVREVVDLIIPGGGDLITDHMIDLVGEGSEKVFFYVGINETAKNKFQSLLMEDKSGMKAAIWLGQQKQRLTKPNKITSKAPPPAARHKGDGKPALSEVKKLKKEYDKVSGKKPQEAYTIKKKAKKAGVDVSDW